MDFSVPKPFFFGIKCGFCRIMLENAKALMYNKAVDYLHGKEVTENGTLFIHAERSLFGED